MAIAKAQCTCSTCNRTFIYRKNCANRPAADSFEAWAQENITECPDCRAARIQSQRDQENAQAAQTAADQQRPALKGSEKQIAWATTIREKCLASVTSYYAAKMSKHPEAAIYQDCLTAYLLKKRAASWWIEKMHSACENFARILAVLNAEEPEEYKALCADVTAKIAEAKKAAAPAAQESASTQQAPRLEVSFELRALARPILTAMVSYDWERWLEYDGAEHAAPDRYEQQIREILNYLGAVGIHYQAERDPENGLFCGITINGEAFPLDFYEERQRFLDRYHPGEKAVNYKAPDKAPASPCSYDFPIQPGFTVVEEEEDD